MVTELRDMGNKLAVYTEDDNLVSRLMRWRGYLAVFDYCRGSRRTGTDVDID